MSTGGWLQVFADSGRMEAALSEAARTSHFVDASAFITFQTLIDWCTPEEGTHGRMADARTVEFAVSRAARRHEKLFGAWVTTPGFAIAVVSTLTHLEEQRATAADLLRISQKFPGTNPLRHRLFALAELWQELDDALSARKEYFPAHRINLAAEHLTRILPRELTRFSRVTIHHGIDLTPSRLMFVEKLATAFQQHPCELELRIPSAGQPELDLPVSESLNAIEKRWQQLDVQVIPEPAEGALNWVLPTAFRANETLQAAPELEFFSTATERAEAQSIARRVATLAREGIALERIAVVHRGSQVSHLWMRRAFLTEGIPLKVRASRPLSETRVGLLSLSILELADDDFPVEPVCQLLESRYASRLSSLSVNPRSLIAQAGIVNNSQGALASRGAWDVRLAALRSRLAQRSKSGGRAVEQLQTAVALILQNAGSIPQQATAITLLTAWKMAVNELSLGQPIQTPGVLSVTEQAELDARDVANFTTLQSAFNILSDALKHSGLAQISMTRREFSRWAHHIFHGIELTERTPRAGAVHLLDARELPGRQFDAVFLRQVAEGIWPGRRPLSLLLSDEECFAVNRAAGARVFRTIARDADVHSTVHEAEDRLLMHLALSSGKRVWVSRPRKDAEGKETLRSPLVDRMSRVVAAFSETKEPAQALAPLLQITNAAEFRSRAILETICPQASRTTAVDPHASVLRRSIGQRDWVKQASRVSTIEYQRLQFFSNPDLPAASFTGQLMRARTRENIQQRLAFTPEHPLSASHLESWATCAFAGYAKNFLRLRQDDEVTEEPGFRGQGDLEHAILADVVHDLVKANAFTPLNESHAQQLISETLERHAEQVERENPVGHQSIWALRKDVMAHHLVTMLKNDGTRTPFDGATPIQFEYGFGKPKSETPRPVELPGLFEGESSISLTGSIDRVDQLGGKLMVIDYKAKVSSRAKSAKTILNPDFQLALYVYVLSVLEKRPVEDAALVPTSKGPAALLSKRLAKVTSLPQLIATDAPTRTETREKGTPNLANAVHELVGRLRAGNFSPRPVDCKYCAFKRVCRITEKALPSDEPGGTT